MTDAIRDQNHVTVALGQSSTSSTTTLPFKIDSVTGRLLVDSASGAGTVTDVSVVSANGFAGTVADSTTTPAITLSTTVTGILEGNGTAISAASTTGSGAVVLATSPTLVTPNIGVATATTLASGAITSTGLLTVSLAGNTARFVNTSDSTPVQVARFEGDRATPADNDEAYLSLMLSNDAGTQTEFTRLRWIATDVNAGTSEDGSFRIAIMSGGVLNNTYIFNPTSFTPSANDQLALGTSSTAFSDLFLAEGGVINWDNGDVTLTQTGDVLAVAGGDLRVATAGVGTNADSVPTLSSTSTLTNKTLTSPTINSATLGGTSVFAEGGAIAYDSASSADGVYTGFVRAGTAGATLAFGDLVYLAAADSRWELADADAASTSDRFLGMCVLAAASDGDPTTILLMGFIRADTAFPTFTIGSPVYVGETAGDVQVAIPTGADNVIRRVGYAWTADELYFNPSMDSQVTVA